MKIVKEFKEFAVKGNMIDIAIGVIIGASFNKVIDVLVKDVFMPPLSLLSSNTKWEDKKVILRNLGVDENGNVVDEVAIGYGKLFEATIDFLVVGITVFMVIKILNTIRRKAHDLKDKSVPTPKDIELLTRMTDLLEKQIENSQKIISKIK